MFGKTRVCHLSQLGRCVVCHSKETRDKRIGFVGTVTVCDHCYFDGRLRQFFNAPLLVWKRYHDRRGSRWLRFFHKGRKLKLRLPLRVYPVEPG